ncbi:MAG: aspartate/glutamate racemase family protein [Butyrivibrio sp.]|nr:aspartate/glutamate racemase family protein [Butyrivibrio sp.]
MKIALVYTGTTPELEKYVNDEVAENIGTDAEILKYADGTIIAEARDAGYVTAGAAARLVTMYMKAVQDGADAILNLCSSVGEVADASQDLAKYLGVPIVRVDEEMCREAVRNGKRIGVLATLQTTLEPTKNTLRRVAREAGRRVELVDGVFDAFGADADKFNELMLEKGKEMAAEHVDVIVLCQGSMAFGEKYLHDVLGIPVLSSPRFGAAELRKALAAKGLIR